MSKLASEKTLLEDYAGQAFKAILTNHEIYQAAIKIAEKNQITGNESIAEASFEYAEAMIAASERRNK